MISFLRRAVPRPVSRTQDVVITGVIARATGDGVHMLPLGRYRLVSGDGSAITLTKLDGATVAQFNTAEIRQLMACRAMRPAGRAEIAARRA